MLSCCVEVNFNYVAEIIDLTTGTCQVLYLFAEGSDLVSAFFITPQ